MDIRLFTENRFYSHLRDKQASLFHPDIRFSAYPSPEAHTLSTGSVQYCCLQVPCSILRGKSTS